MEKNQLSETTDKPGQIYTGHDHTASDIKLYDDGSRIIINGTHICVKSVFNGSLTLEKAFGNVIRQKLVNQKYYDAIKAMQPCNKQQR